MKDVRQVVLWQRDVEMLVHCVANEAVRARLEKLNVPAGRSVTAAFNPAEVGAIADALGDELCQVGLGGDGEPNTLGLCIEALIDRFNPYE